MAFQNSSLTSFVVGLLILLYLSTFIIFAVLRILWGISIQRLWWNGLRRLSYTPREGVRIDIRGLRLSLHYPTFAQPTWISIVLTEPKVTLDLALLSSGRPGKVEASWVNDSPSPPTSPKSVRLNPVSEPESDSESDIQDQVETNQLNPPENISSRTWTNLVKWKDQIKKLHSIIHWIRMVDIVATDTFIVVDEIGHFQLSRFSVAVDTRMKAVDRGKIFSQGNQSDRHGRPAEWIFTFKSLLFSLEDQEDQDVREIIDAATLKIHGMLYRNQQGLRDASISLKFGNIILPYDDLTMLGNKLNRQQKINNISLRRPVSGEIEIPQTPIKSSSEPIPIKKTTNDSKNFVTSTLRGIQEVQLAIGYVELSKKLASVESKGAPVHINMSMKEVGIDLLKLDRTSPAHLTYFSRNDVAHQALLTAISISVGIDDGHNHAERLLYIPLATATIKTTLPSKAIYMSNEGDAKILNSNVLFANLVVTSPSIDLDPKHLPLTVSLLESWRARPKHPSRRSNFNFLSKILPKANIKVSIHEPVLRVSLPCMEVKRRGTGEYDLLISSLSSINLNIESSHSADENSFYGVTCTYRVNSHYLYYQTASGEQSNLHVAKNLEVKTEVMVAPHLSVSISGNLETFSLYMVRPEICEGIRQIVVHLNTDVSKRTLPHQREPKSILRNLPSWLQHIRLKGSDFNFEVAGVDPTISNDPKGVYLHLDTWVAEYKADRTDDMKANNKSGGRRGTIRSLDNEDLFMKPRSSSSSSQRHKVDQTDGRRLTVHVTGLNAYTIDSTDPMESEPVIAIPKFEVAFSTLTEQEQLLFHINAVAKYIYMHYSLSRHFAIGIGTTVLKKTFTRPKTEQELSVKHGRSKSEEIRPSSPNPFITSQSEITTIDIRSSLFQLKVKTPADPNLMLQVCNLETGQHRWKIPFFKSSLLRLYASTPRVQNSWSRIISIRNIRLDYRISKKKHHGIVIEEQSADVVMDAIRIAVPHQLIVHKIFDNLTNIVKTTQHLHHRFRSEGSAALHSKGPQKPKRVPRISLRSQTLMFELEDSLFEWKLGLIYTQGLHEQRQRLARLEALDVKMKKVSGLETSNGTKKELNDSKERKGWRRSKSKRPSSEDLGISRRPPTIEEPISGLVDEDKVHTSVNYDSHGRVHISDHGNHTYHEAKIALDELNARSWKHKIDEAYKFQQQRMQKIRSNVWGQDEIPEGIDQKERIRSIPQRPGLLSILLHNLSLVIDKPSFQLNEYTSFLSGIGKGIPADTQYALLIPMKVNIAIGDARATLRDYPIPLLQIPHVRSSQNIRLPAFTLNTDFVIAEEYRNYESMRTVQVVVVPPSKTDEPTTKGLTVNIQRTVGSIKSYSDISVEINSAEPTIVSWGASYQPCIQDSMQVIESFQKPPVDPSQRVGFWDKLRLSFHSRIKVEWKHGGDLHLVLKGSRDPYHVTGSGAGFVMCWRQNVSWNVNETSDPKKFINIKSSEYVLAIPDFGHFARNKLNGISPDNSHEVIHTENTAKFQKTIMKLSGNVQWLVGIVLERNLDDGSRSFDFIPHYQVVLKNPKYAKCNDDLEYDAFRGFRSHHIHLSIAIAAPVNRDWTVTNLKPTSNYNSIHLTPRFFSHFFKWWAMFSGNLSLPIRQGKLWPGLDKTSKKFGRHLATIKFNLLLSPLYLSHIYKYRGPDEHGRSTIFATGLKVKLDNFMLDLHQRREYFKKVVQGSRTRTSGIRINKAQVDFIAADFRAVSAMIKETSLDDLDTMSEERLASYSENNPRGDLSNIYIPDQDTGWIDMDDFVELDWLLPVDSIPETQILPLAFAPRFTYFRQTDHHDLISGDPNRSSPFGNEDTHDCVMSARNDPRRVQCDIIQDRLDKLAGQISRHNHDLGQHELSLVRTVNPEPEERDHVENMRTYQKVLEHKQEFLNRMLKQLLRRVEDHIQNDDHEDHDHMGDEFFEAREEFMAQDSQEPIITPYVDDISDFSNRFIVHNVQFKWNNSLRDIVLRYIHQVSQRRGFIYYLSRPAVKFILDIVDEQTKARHSTSRHSRRDTEPGTPITPFTEADNSEAIQDRIQQLLDDKKKIVDAFELNNDKSDQKANSGGNGDDIAREFTPQNSYHVRLIAPQIQLQTDKDVKSAILVTAKSIHLKVIQIMDKDRLMDDVSGLVQRRFNAEMDSLQIFVTNRQKLSKDLLSLYSANRYGTPAGSFWPPWLPLEDMYDAVTDPYGFTRVVHRTSVELRYDKFNSLRLKYNDDISYDDENEKENRMDHLTINFPKLHTKCDSDQYYALAIIVLDLLLYNEPQEKTREETLEKIMLTTDFSDLSAAPNIVTKLQERIRVREELKLMFQLLDASPTREQWKQRVILEHDLAKLEDELFFIMKAITTAQSKVEERGGTTATLKWDVSAEELAWHMIGADDKSLIELQLKGVDYHRLDNSNGSNDNTLELKSIQGWTLLENAKYPQLLARYREELDNVSEIDTKPMVCVKWYMLENVGGIVVIDYFSISIIPLKIQAEWETGTKLFEYMFPSKVKDGHDGIDTHVLVSGIEDDDETFDSDSGKYLDVPNDNLTGAGDLELRLKPTLSASSGFSFSKTPRTPKSAQSPYDLRRFRHGSTAEGTDLRKILGIKRMGTSNDRVSSNMNLRPLSIRSNHLGSELGRKERDGTSTPRFHLSRSNIEMSKKRQKSTDVVQMLDRANKYMALTYIRMDGVVLCLSYNNTKGSHNMIPNIHDLVFRLPTTEYRNKTWSNFDLYEQLRKDVKTAILAHTGTIIGNIVSRHKPSKMQQSRLRELAASSIMLGSNRNHDNEDQDQINHEDPIAEEMETNDTGSIQSTSSWSGQNARGSMESGQNGHSNNGHSNNGHSNNGHPTSNTSHRSSKIFGAIARTPSKTIRSSGSTSYSNSRPASMYATPSPNSTIDDHTRNPFRHIRRLSGDAMKVKEGITDDDEGTSIKEKRKSRIPLPGFFRA